MHLERHLNDRRPHSAIPEGKAQRLAGKWAPSLCVALALASSSPQAQAPLTVSWANDRLSVRASDALLSDIVAEVGRLAGVQVIGSDNLAGRLTVDFADLLIIEALRTLLTDVNYFVHEQRESQGSRTWLVLRVHSMARANATPAFPSAVSLLGIPAIDALIEIEAAEAADGELDEQEDPDLQEENRANKLEAKALAASGAFGVQASVSTLLEYMKSEKGEIRLEAVKAFSKRPIAMSLAPLTEALADDSIAVRRAAIEVLGRATDRESLEKVGLLLEKHPESLVRFGALRILALRGDPASIVHLDAVTKDPDAAISEIANQLIFEFFRRARANKTKG
jgi:hypothetical protein